MADGSRSANRSVSELVKDDRRFSVVSFFAGCGGLDLGFLGGFDYLGRSYSRTRFNVLAAYDADPQAVDTYARNIGAHIALADLANAELASMPKADVLLGGFPCQEFSQCGPRRGLNSERGQLYRAMVDYAEHHAPALIVGENVAGLLYRDSGRALKTIQLDFERIGYRSHVWEVRAEEFGVPQARHRVFLIFVRNDIPDSCLGELQPTTQISSRMALSDLLKPGRSTIANQAQYFRAAKAGNGHGQGDEKTPADGPAYTVRANSRSRVQFHYSRPRRLTVRECARLQTFPDNFIFPFAATANMRLIGNAVPPVLGHVVATHIQEFLLGQVSLMDGGGQCDGSESCSNQESI